MRRVVHINGDTIYTVAGGMTFMKNHVDQTVIVAHQPDDIDRLIAALQLQKEDLRGDAGVQDSGGHD